jgi:DNA-binding transcriptional regulator YiaG
VTAEQIKTLRYHLGESREIFGTRFAVSRRTVEGWEQGLRKPSKLTIRALVRLERRKGNGKEQQP